jgi:small-conductance mechanosensitive channel
LQAPDAFRQRLADAQNDIATLIQNLRPQRDALLDLLERAVDLRSRITALSGEIATRRNQLNHEVRAAEAAPLWSAMAHPGLNIQAVLAEIRLQWLSILAYTKAHAALLIALALGLYAVAYSLMHGLRTSLESERAGIDIRPTRRVIAHSGRAALLLTLLGVFYLAPAAPIAFYDVLWLIVPLPAAMLCQSALGGERCLTLWALAASLLLSPFRSLLELMPTIDRLVICGQLLLVGCAFLYDLRRMRGGKLNLHAPRWLVQWAAILLLVGMLAALYANLAGYVGLARALRNGLLGSMGFAMVYVAAYHVLLGLGLVVLRSSGGQVSRLVRERRQHMEVLMRWVLRVVLAFGLAISPFYAFGIDDQLPGLINGLMSKRIEIGEAGIGVGALTAAVLCLLATYGVVRILKAVLNDELLPRLRIDEGAAYATSMLIRYAVAVLGFLLAISAAGIDLSKMVLLAGAVGVGIGFGLQNIVNNFISGLILLVEQPIHVGDLVETSSATGVVKHIGIRASTITTAQGADVVVPNGELLSRDLINWTLSNRRRRIDVDIGAAYASNPEQVKQLLVEVLSANARVLKQPEPAVLFMGFGDSALNFRASAWVAEVNDAAVIASDVRSEILARFIEVGIEIPFPQRDVWVRSTGAEEGGISEAN